MRRRSRTWMVITGVAMAILGLVISALPLPVGAAERANTPTDSISPTVAPTSTPAATATLTPAESQEPQINGFGAYVYVDPTSGAKMSYYLHIPDDYIPSLSYPLVLLLHGTGESAKNNKTAEKNASVLLGDPYVKVWSSASIQARWPSFILVPQVVTPARWSDGRPGKGSYTLQPQPQPSLQMVMAILAKVKTLYPINSQRIYLTGLSMGGYGAWEAAERWPSVFAAVVPISGAGDPAKAADLVNVPVWVFQSAHDTVVPISGSLDMINAIKAAKGHPCFTEFAGSSHNTSTWMAVYTDNTLLKWLFAQGTPGATAVGMQQCAA